MKSDLLKSDRAKQPAPARTDDSARGWFVLAVVMVIAAGLLIAFPAQRQPSLLAFRHIAVEMLSVMPAVLVILGLFAVWIPKEMVTRHLGRHSGPRGVLTAIVFGTLPTGPLYAAFPITRGFLDKGASPANAFIFLATWACIKIPQELVELQFLGWRFTVARLVFTVAVVVTTAFVFQRFLREGRIDAPAGM